MSDSPPVGPIEMPVKAGETYWCCTCGRSAGLPFCDGSHREGDKGPIPYTPAASKSVNFCPCGTTKNPPFCDGSHKEPG